MPTWLAILGGFILLSMAEERLPKIVGDLLFGTLFLLGAAMLFLHVLQP